ncbi:MAG: ABC transporter permease [Chloroflexota bacterium]|nr:ABC transporter permease [Chloroflexota bacterium]
MSAATFRTAYARASLLDRLAGLSTSGLDFLRLLATRPVGLAGFVGVLFFLVLGFVAPVFVPVNNTVNVAAIYSPPSLTYPLGTDYQGRDVLNQIIHGGRDILMVAFLAGLISTSIAVTFGALGAVVGGRADAAILALTDVVLTIPRVPLLVVLAALLRLNNILVVAVLVGLLAWPSLLRAVRAQVLSLKEREFVEAARSLDLGLGHIIFSEILPNMRSYIVISFILAMTQAIYAQAGLIFLGLVPLSGQNWGVMINLAWTRGAIFFRDSLMYILSPVLAIALFQLSLVSLASGLEDIFNPRLRGSA